MDIQFTEEQELLRNSVQRLLKDEYDFDARRRIVVSEDGWSRTHWKKFADMGLLAAPFAEEFGGFGEGALATMIVMQEFGRRLVVEPFFETVVLAGGLIEAEGTDAQRREHLTGIAAGESIWALAWAEPGARYDLNNVSTTARRSGDHYILSGAKAAVIGAPWADRLIVSARTSGDRRDRQGVSLFIVDRQSAGLHLQSFKTIDGRRAAEITMKDVQVPAAALLGGEGEGAAILEACRDRAIGALCAEAVGAMSELNSATLDYAKTRKQFGVALGTFQVLQHRMVDMFIAHQEAVSLTQHLTLTLASKDSGTTKLASGAKTKVGYAARFIGEQAIQLHGGMGMSDELVVGHYFKRIGAIDIQFGDSAFHLMRFAHTN
ncbi:MAG: pimeloyl-CoA dehydrogenase small subunit [Tardiphaga sp.]|jgi:alkylation response protein AidB-like acyl-CoA dehydrogenase|uniref:acyl-CoA dehydrogenase family protein n=1 Tax=Tardiphaga sp. TaxID=1926292 RepID=UPI00262821C6|nr:acyl-CoA dehydrogenase family protein [Tardiphaga sp.]MDB5503774.1 pimeloyl-CoA dehydrogenase small subunit [Tardiphaga sp.]